MYATSLYNLLTFYHFFFSWFRLARRLVLMDTIPVVVYALCVTSPVRLALPGWAQTAQLANFWLIFLETLAFQYAQLENMQMMRQKSAKLVRLAAQTAPVLLSVDLVRVVTRCLGLSVRIPATWAVLPVELSKLTVHHVLLENSWTLPRKLA